jgi:hypothetical protein
MLLYWFADFSHTGIFVDFHNLLLIFNRRHYIESELSSEAAMGELGAQICVSMTLK